MSRHGKKYKKSLVTLEQGGKYDISQALDILALFEKPKFDETVEISMKLGIDPKQADQTVRGSFSMPHGLGKEKHVIVFAEGAKAEEAKNAGAAEIGTDDLIKRISDGWMDFDVAIAAPEQMKKVGKIARILGPQGKMPSPKAGTVTNDIAAIVKEFRAGRIGYRNDSDGNLHAPVGKRSFPKEKLQENVEAFVEHIRKRRPASSKGVFIRSLTLSATMSPGVSLTV